MANPSEELKNIFAGGGVKLKKVVREEKPPPPESPKPPISVPLKPRRPKLVTKAEADFDYTAEQEDELSFAEGDIFLVLNKNVYDGWALGEMNGKKGVFPNNFVRFFEEEGESEPEDKPIPRKKKFSSVPPTGLPTVAPASSTPDLGPVPTSALPAKPPDTSHGARPTSGPPIGVRTSIPPTSAPPVAATSGRPPASLPPVAAPSSKPPAPVPTVAAPPVVALSGRPPASVPPVVAPSIKPPAAVSPVGALSGRPPASLPPVVAPSSKPPAPVPPVGALSGRPPASTPPEAVSRSRPPRSTISSEYSEFTIGVDETNPRPLTAEELRQYALEHKDEFVKTSDSTGKRKPADPSTVVSATDVRTKISSSRRRAESLDKMSATTLKRNSGNIKSPPSLDEAPERVESPERSVTAERRSVFADFKKPARSASSDPTLAPAEVSDTAVSEGSDMYMIMNLDSDVAALWDRIEALEKANQDLRELVDRLEPAASGAGNGDGLAEVVGRLEAAEAANAKTNKLMTLLQGDLDEEINARKQLETEVTKLKRTVKLLQG